MGINARFAVGFTGGILAAAGGACAHYWYRNIHWFDEYEKSLKAAGAVERRHTLPDGHVINYGEVANDKAPLLLIHGQMGIWQDYALVLPELSRSWHVYAIDVFGHGKSSHNEETYYLDVNGDAIISFINDVIGAPTVVAGHSNGAITAAYVAAYGGANVAAAILEDPPIFSTQGEGWEESFAYLDTYKPLHDYGLSDHAQCWEAYYLEHCLWGQLFMKGAMPGLARYAQRYHDRHPQEAVKIGFLPASVWSLFEYARQYDFAYGEHFYDLSWNHGLTHEEVLSSIEVPCLFIHAKESVSPDGTFLCAASREQAERAVAYIGNTCRLIETTTSDHVIHTVHRDLYVDAVNSMHEYATVS